MAEIKSTWEIVQERFGQMDKEAEETRGKKLEQIAALESKAGLTSADSIELARLYYENDDLTSAIRTLAPLPESPERAALRERITDTVTPALRATFAAFRSKDYKEFESRSKKLLNRIRCNLSYFFCGLAEIMQGKPDTHLEMFRKDKGADIGASIADYVYGEIRDDARGGTERILHSSKTVEERREREAFYRLPEVFNHVARYEPDDPYTIVELNKMLLLKGDASQVLENLSGFLPDTSSSLALLAEYHHKRYINREFKGVPKYPLASILHILAMALSNSHKNMAAMVLDNLLNEKNGLLDTVQPNTADMYRRLRIKIAVETGDARTAVKQFPKIQNLLYKALETPSLIRAAISMDPALVDYSFDYLNRISEGISSSGMPDKGLEMTVDLLRSFARDALLKYHMTRDDWTDFINILAGEPDLRLSTAETKESSIDILCRIRAQHRAMCRYPEEQIVKDINDVVPGAIQSFKHHDDGGFTIVSGMNKSVAATPVFRRCVSQEVDVLKIATAKEEVLYDQDDLAHFRNERVDEACADHKENIDSAAESSIVPSEIISQTLGLAVSGSIGPIKTTGKRDLNYSAGTVLKRFMSEDDFLFESSALRKVISNPVVNVPAVIEVFEGNGFHVMNLQQISGIDLCDFVYATSNRQVCRELIEHHLLALAYLQDACGELHPGPGKGDRLKPSRQDYRGPLTEIDLSLGLDLCPRIADILNGFEQRPYRDASLFNCRIHMLNVVADHADDELIEQTIRISNSASLEERMHYALRVEKELLIPYDEQKVRMLRDNMYQLDFGGFKRTAFPLEDFLLAVDNPFLAPTQKDIHRFILEYFRYLSELTTFSSDNIMTIENVPLQLAAGGLYRQLKNFHYIQKGRLDYSEYNQEFKQYYLARASRYAEECVNLGVLSGHDHEKLCEALRRLNRDDL
ncbi:hypothetical protein JW898_03665 [Candidatus Woesearchaeota archaeon]|nr:hypothetical protein [Candidatus Woesearchaeota archaeon]